MGICKGDTEPITFTRNYFDKGAVVQQKLLEHYNAAVELYGADMILGVWLQGSQNYKLDYDGSDVDTKCIIIPSLDDIALNRKPVSTTHIMADESHLDAKDLRLYFDCFRKQNVNFVEILFTDYAIVNQDYLEEWNTLRFNREAIARMCEYKAVKSMKGISMEKYAALEKPYPCQAEEIAKFGYSAKQLHHLLRIEYFIEQYVNGELYEKCLVPPVGMRAELIKIKATHGLFTLDQARARAKTAIEHITQMADNFCNKNELKCDEFASNLLDITLTEIIKKSLKKEIS